MSHPAVAVASLYTAAANTSSNTSLGELLVAPAATATAEPSFRGLRCACSSRGRLVEPTRGLDDHVHRCHRRRCSGTAATPPAASPAGPSRQRRWLVLLMLLLMGVVSGDSRREAQPVLVSARLVLPGGRIGATAVAVRGYRSARL